MTDGAICVRNWRRRRRLRQPTAAWLQRVSDFVDAKLASQEKIMRKYSREWMVAGDD
jgi:hypothetical protein